MLKVKVRTQEYRMNTIAFLQFQIPEYKDDQSPFFWRIVKNSWFFEAYDIILHSISLQLNIVYSWIFNEFLKLIWERLFPSQVCSERRLPATKMKIGAPC